MKNILFWYGSIQQMSFEVNLQQFHSKQDKKSLPILHVPFHSAKTKAGKMPHYITIP